MPWANAPAPGWAVAGRRLDFQGTTQTLLRDSPLPPLPPSGLALSFGIQRAAGKSVLATMTTRSASGSGLPPHETSTARCYGSTSLLGLWVSPDALRRLQPNQVIDRDTITQRRIVFMGLQGNAAVFMDQGPGDTSYNSFDTQSGMLVGFQSAEQMANIGQRQIRLQLAGTR